MSTRAKVACAIVALLLAGRLGADERPVLRVASKPFTESYILAEIAAGIAESAGEARVERHFGMGGPDLVFEALRNGSIELDVNYTGSIAHVLLKERRGVPFPELRERLARAGLVTTEPLGFNNTYALAVDARTARRLGLRRVSDLRGHPELRGAFTPDFLNFEDGLYAMQDFYGFRLDSARPMQHSLAYQAIASGSIDITDAYTTDGALARFDLTLLEDDRQFFPKYLGVIVVRAEFPRRFPATWTALRRLEGSLSDGEMTALNAAVETGRATFEQAARSFLRERGDAARASLPEAGGWRWLWVSTLEHLTLVVVSLALSCLIGIPCGILAFRRPRLGGMLVVISALLQTIPTLALLCFLIPLLGIGSLPTIAALFLYGLLPIVQSTCSGLLSLDPRLTETAVILGLTPTERLLRVELPLASVNILAGVKTTAVINVATAAIAALIGAGGYGRFITAGLAMNDTATILRGAIPTAAMAVAVHLFFNLLGRFVVPRGLRR